MANETAEEVNEEQWSNQLKLWAWVVDLRMINSSVVVPLFICNI